MWCPDLTCQIFMTPQRSAQKSDIGIIDGQVPAAKQILHLLGYWYINAQWPKQINTIVRDTFYPLRYFLFGLVVESKLLFLKCVQMCKLLWLRNINGFGFLASSSALSAERLTRFASSAVLWLK